MPALDAAGIEHQAVFNVGSPYISCARATLLRKALDAKADAVLFIDHDVAASPDAFVKIVQSDADVAAGLYRFKQPETRYMGTLIDGPDMRPVVREDGLIAAELVPAGFLKVTREAVARMMRAYPELIYGDPISPHFDLFHHGACDGLWWGEDFALSRRWRAMGETLWVVPDLDLTHHGEDEAFPGNFHRHLLAQPGGSEDPRKDAA